MTLPNEYIASIHKAFEKFEESLNGSKAGFFHEYRKEAIATLAKTGLPGPKHEEYKFTNLGKALEKNVPYDQLFKQGPATPSPSPFDQFDGYKIYLSNGRLIPLKSDLSDLSDKVVISSFDDALKTETGLQNYAGKLMKSWPDTYSHLNTAFAKEGVFIKVKRNAVLEKPLLIIHHNDSDNQEIIANYRHLLIMEESAQATVLETSISTGSHTSYTNQVLEIFCEKNSTLEWSKLQLEGDSALRIDNTLVSQRRDSKCTVNTITFGGQIVRNNLYMALDDPNTEAHMYGLYLIGGKTHVDNHTSVDHKHPNCFSSELYKGIMGDQSHGVFNGKIFVRQDAQKTNAFQQNNNILLSPQAVINTKPQLEIWADDVKCSHGCTIGQLDEEQVFYLRSRGISKDSARAMLLHAFAKDVLEKISVPEAVEYLENHLTAQLH